MPSPWDDADSATEYLVTYYGFDLESARVTAEAVVNVTQRRSSARKAEQVEETDGDTDG